jgi:type IV pilus assembly protein PilB
MEISESLRDMIITSAPAGELRAKAMAEGMLTLRQSGLEKVREGSTTLEEVVRETM